MDDEEVYKVMWEGQNLGIFQFEASGISSFVNACQPKNIHDVAMITASYRPGPMAIPGLLSRIAAKIRGDMEDGDFIFPKYSYIFKNAHNELIYQEGFMQLSMDMCGFNQIQADMLREATGKKKIELLKSLKEKFIEGAVKNGEYRKDVEEFWEHLLGFASYSFNASHAYSYGHLTYYTAWLKAHYPVEFYASIISTETDVDQASLYMDDARKRGIQILPPDINESESGFSIANGNIIYGFSAIKGLGNAIIDQFNVLRPFYSFGDFLIKTYLLGLRFNKKAYDALIKSGSLDSFGYKRSVMLANYERFLTDFDPDGSIKKSVSLNKKVINSDVASYIKEFLNKQDEYFVDNSISEFTLFEVLNMEKELLGIHITGNPFDIVLQSASSEGSTFEEIEREVNENGRFAGSIVVAFTANRVIKTKTGKDMCFVEADDSQGNKHSMTAFSEVYNANKLTLRNGMFAECFVTAKHSYKGDGSIDITINSVTDLSSKMEEVSKKISKQREIKEAVIKYEGIPSSVKSKSILSKLNSIVGTPDISTAKGKIYIDFIIRESEYEYYDSLSNIVNTLRIGPYFINEININTIRELNSLPGVTIKTR